VLKSSECQVAKDRRAKGSKRCPCVRSKTGPQNRSVSWLGRSVRSTSRWANHSSPFVLTIQSERYSQGLCTTPQIFDLLLILLLIVLPNCYPQTDHSLAKDLCLHIHSRTWSYVSNQNWCLYHAISNNPGQRTKQTRPGKWRLRSAYYFLVVKLLANGRKYTSLSGGCRSVKALYKLYTLVELIAGSCPVYMFECGVLKWRRIEGISREWGVVYASVVAGLFVVACSSYCELPICEGRVLIVEHCR
jgi:hypothetical protein